VPAIIEEVKSSLAAGMSVVIGLQTTGEVYALTLFIHVPLFSVGVSWPQSNSLVKFM